MDADPFVQPEDEIPPPPATFNSSRPSSNAPSAPPPSAPVRVSFRPPTIPPPVRDYEGEIAALQQQLDACVRTMTRMRRRVLEASERQLVELSVSIAERIVGRELSTDPELVVSWAQEGVAALAAEDSLTVTVSSDIGQVLQDVESWLGERDVRVVVDPALESGACEVRGEMGKVDASLRARIAAMSETLGVREEDDVRS